MREFRFVGTHADELEGGRPISPGEFTGPIDPEETRNKQLIDEGLLIPLGDVPDEEPPKLTGDALKARAEELDIEGRSSMPADDLRAAIAAEESNNENEEGDD